MIDFEKEEFLSRLDIRICAIVSALGSHEKYLCSNLPHKEFHKIISHIDKANQEILDYISNTDQKIQENFWNIGKHNNSQAIRMPRKMCDTLRIW